ncbi:MAG: packaged DNA stabilization protein gp10 [Chlorobium sp.]|uniref:hypothetical protein n=1 Tax=Chlorobium sp. TaxID=1095 RepID=UPI002F412E17
MNLYAEQVPSSKKTPAVLIGTPGLAPFAELPTAPIYGMIEHAGFVYTVTATNLYRVAYDGSLLDLGNVTIAGKVWMATNGVQLVFVDGIKGYWFHHETGVTEFSGEGWYPANTVTVHDSRFLFNRKDTGQFFISGLLDVSLDPLDFATAESSADNLIAVLSDSRYVLMFGGKTIEFWYNSGDSSFPYERIQGGIVDKGCVAVHSIAKTGSSVYWLGDDATVYRFIGYTPERISTHAVEYDIKKGRIDDAEAFTYIDEGHSFYVLTLPSQRKTWCFDATTGLWHEREHRGFGRVPASCHVRFGTLNLVGDFQSGMIYSLDLNAADDNGTCINREVRFPVLYNGGRNVTVKSIELDVLHGVGRVSGKGADPQAVFTWSDDEGKNWSNEHWRSLGKIGERKVRVKVNRLGVFLQRLFRVSISSPVKVVIQGLYADIL